MVLDVEMQTHIEENRYYTIMDCLIDMSAFTYFLSVVLAILTTGYLYENYSLNMARHIRAK